MIAKICYNKKILYKKFNKILSKQIKMKMIFKISTNFKIQIKIFKITIIAICKIKIKILWMIQSNKSKMLIKVKINQVKNKVD